LNCDHPSLDVVEIDQQAAPIDRVLDSHGWADLGVFKVDTTGSDNSVVC